MFKFKDLITVEEASVMGAVATGTLETICGGDVKEINNMLEEARKRK